MPDLDVAELFGWVNEVDVPDDLRQQVERRRTLPVSGESRPTHARPRRTARAGRWVIGAVAAVAVLAALALAAHSRGQSPADTGATQPMRVVPDVRGKSVVAAIASLQQRGFAVSVPDGFHFGSLNAWPTAGRETPKPGTKLPVGATVTLTGLRYGCCMGSPVSGPNPRTPHLVGDTTGEALQTMTRLHLPWQINVLGFRHQRRFLATNAHVIAQSPAPGVLLTHGGGFRVPTMTVSYQTNNRHVITAATSIRVMLPGGWSSRSFSGGLGADPHGVQVMVAADRSLPASVTECEALIPHLRSDQVIVRIYDYGSGPLAPRAAQVSVVKLGKILPVKQPNGRTVGFNEIRVRYRGHALKVDTSFGSPHPSAAIRTQVAALLGTITTR